MNKKKGNPPFPKPAPNAELEAGTSIVLMSDFDRFSNGHLCFTISQGKFSDEGKHLGTVCGVMDYPTLVFDFPGKDKNSGGRRWKLDVESLFRLVMKADAEYVKHAERSTTNER